MFALNTIVLAIAALAATAQGAPTEATFEARQNTVACPPNGRYCGFYIQTNRCAGSTDAENIQHLQAISPPGTNVYDSIYETDPTGYVWRWVEQCSIPGSCVNIQLPNVPSTFCRR